MTTYIIAKTDNGQYIIQKNQVSFLTTDDDSPIKDLFDQTEKTFRIARENWSRQEPES